MSHPSLRVFYWPSFVPSALAPPPATGSLHLPCPLPDPLFLEVFTSLLLSPPCDLHFSITSSVRPLFATPFKIFNLLPTFLLSLFFSSGHLSPADIPLFYLFMIRVTPPGGDSVTTGSLILFVHSCTFSTQTAPATGKSSISTC